MAENGRGTVESGKGRAKSHPQTLQAENVDTRKYHDPPVHTHQTYRHLRDRYDHRLPVTNWVAPGSLSLPVYSHMNEATVDGICTAIERVHAYADEVRGVLRKGED